MLYSGKEGSGNMSDSFKTVVIDTIVAEVQSVPGEDRCVLLLGYKDQIETMFQNVVFLEGKHPALIECASTDDLCSP